MDFNTMDTSLDNSVVNSNNDIMDNSSGDISYTYDNQAYTTEAEPQVTMDETPTINSADMGSEEVAESSEDDLDNKLIEIENYYDQLKNITIENLKLQKQLKEIEDKIKENNIIKTEIQEKYADKF